MIRDYVHASGHLNRIVYQTPKGHRLTLTWAERVKIMQQLLQGKFGFDVRYAMSPQFELDDSAEITKSTTVPATSANGAVSAFRQVSQADCRLLMCR